MKELTGAPLRIATRQRITTPYTRNIKLTYIVGTKPLQDYYGMMFDTCELCTWIICHYNPPRDSLYKLKYVNRLCYLHNRLIGPRER